MTSPVLDVTGGEGISQPMECVLRQFMLAVEANAKMLTVAESQSVSDAFIGLLRASFHGCSEALENAKATIDASRYDRARRFINDNLTSPQLTPEHICVRLGISKRQLYTLFEQHGGVVSFIKKRRLSACFKALRNVRTDKLISTIAYDHGFTNLSSFYRQFHAQYGFRPGEARSAWLNGYQLTLAKSNTFGDWLARNSEV